MLEHHDLSRQVERWEKGMRAISASVAGSRKAGSDRWWDGYWDEDESENTRSLDLLTEPPTAQVGAQNGPNVPVFRVAYDRQTIRYTRNEAS